MMTKPTDRAQPSTIAPLSRWDGLLAVALGLMALALYTLTLAPGLLNGDAGEFQFAAWRLGLAHPTGYPLYLILGSGWQHGLALLGADPAWALNLFSAVTAGVTVALLFVLMRKAIPGPLGISRGVALFSAGLFGANPTFWSQALIAEVYALHGLLIVLILLAALAWDGSARSTILLAGLLGLGLTHHRTTLFLIPGVLWGVWLVQRSALGRRRLWLGGTLALLLPQLLYLYIPLRATPDASPWYFPRLGGETISLYTHSFRGFLDYLTGSVFSVSFFGPDQALARLPEVGQLWLDHFTWIGLGLILLGAIGLIREKRWSILALTLPFALILQVFNLFYGIGDIYVYYIPLYLVGAIYAGLGVSWGLGIRDWGVGGWGKMVMLVALLILPGSLVVGYLPQVDQSTNRQAETLWAAILATNPPQNATLISNDRNEIVPLYYLQHVEGLRPDLTGIFPLLTPAERFADVGATVATALRADRPVVLIKPMPGLESRFTLSPLADPLVEVTGSAGQTPPRFVVDLAYGPLTLLGYDWVESGEGARVVLHWRVDAPVDGEFTTTVQIFDADGEKLAQDDRPAGGAFYPTGLWKVGEMLLDRHDLDWASGPKPARLLVGMYTGPGFQPLAPALEISLPGELE